MPGDAESSYANARRRLQGSSTVVVPVWQREIPQSAACSH